MKNIKNIKKKIFNYQIEILYIININDSYIILYNIYDTKS